MEQVMMEELNVSGLFSIGTSVKSLEILFQKKVENTLEANGFNDCWWQALNHEPIFMTVWQLVCAKENVDESVIFNVQDYYNKLRTMTDKYIGEKLCK